MTQDDLLYRFRPRVFAIAAELGTVRAACRAMGIHPSTYYRWKRQLDRHGPEILAQSPCRNVPLPKIEREEMPFSPPPRSSTWPRRSTPASGHWCSSAPTPACGSDSWPGYARAEPTCWPGRSPWPRSSPRSRQSNRRPPKTRAGRRTVGLPPFVVHELEAHLAAAQRPSTTSSPPPVGALRVPGFRARSWVPATDAAGLRIHDLRDTAVALWIAAGATPKEVAVRGAHLGQLHPGPLRPPDDPLASRGGPVPSSTGLDYEARQHGRKPQDARSPRYLSGAVLV